MHTEVLYPQLPDVGMNRHYQRMASTRAIVNLLQQAAQIERVGLVAITLQFGIEENASKVAESIHHFLESLRPRIRKTDMVLLLDQTCYFVLRGANQQGTSIVQERLWEALLWAVLNINETELLRPGMLTAGQGVYPEPQTTIEHCLHSALEPTQRFTLHREHSRPKGSSSSVNLNRPIQEHELPILARQLGIPYLSLLPRNLPKRVLRLIKRQVAQELSCFPLGRERDTLTVAMIDPQNQQIIERLQSETGLRIFPVLTHPQELQNALELL